jgi:VIT1/CCC1 family predicted Fe2+/Mn2+ transporter
MSDVQPSGLRLWLGSLVHWPARRLEERIGEAEDRLEEMRGHFQIELERQARRFELRAASWAITALLFAISGIFFLLGVWFGLDQVLGPIAASFLLAILFGMLSVLPLLFLRRALRTDGNR